MTDATGWSGEESATTRLKINVVTIFPEFFAGPLGLSIPSRARDAGLVEYRIIDLRDFTHDRHRTVDDAPYGGGAGMVMKPGPFFEAVESMEIDAFYAAYRADGRSRPAFDPAMAAFSAPPSGRSVGSRAGPPCRARSRLLEWASRRG